jgi:hypothetical protein
MITNWIKKIASWIQSFWNQLDDSTKRKIIEVIAKEFGILLRAFYRYWKSQSTEQGEA